MRATCRPGCGPACPGKLVRDRVRGDVERELRGKMTLASDSQLRGSRKRKNQSNRHGLRPAPISEATYGTTLEYHTVGTVPQ